MNPGRSKPLECHLNMCFNRSDFLCRGVNMVNMNKLLKEWPRNLACWKFPFFLFTFFKVSFLFPIFWEKIPDSSCALRLYDRDLFKSLYLIDHNKYVLYNWFPLNLNTFILMSCVPSTYSAKMERELPVALIHPVSPASPAPDSSSSGEKRIERNWYSLVAAL